ncbi:hypothetical protein Tco_0806478, partial [Tanacetum coccineum]
ASSSKSAQVRNQGLVAEAYEWDEEDVSSDDNKMVEVKVIMALTNDESGVVGKEIAKNGIWVKISIRKHENTKILKDNETLRKELKELTYIIETWLNISNKVNQCISEQIPNQKRKIVGADQLTEETFNSGQKDLLSEVKGLILPNYDTGRILPSGSQVNVTDSSVTDYDSAEQFTSVCSISLPPLEKLPGVEPQNGPKTIKSILKSSSTIKVETSKGVIINETNTSSNPAKGNKNVSTSKKHSAPAGKLKDVKTEDDIPMSVVMKELKYLKL